MAEKPQSPNSGSMEDRPADLSLTRAKFINELYPEIFGAEAVGDPIAEITPTELHGILVAYEDFLKTKGLLDNGRNQATKET